MYKQSIKLRLKKIKLFLLLLLKKSVFYYRFKDQLYTFQQNEFRGSFDEIRERQKVYLPYIKGINKKLLSEHGFLDCGFGRGEFLELLRENGVKKCEGVDLNNEYVSEALNKNLSVHQADVISFLYLSNKKFGGISSFHMIEHLNFSELFDFLLLVFKKLHKGGILIMETPNVENIVVSSTTFYYDHTHIQKIPKEFLIKIMQFIGYSKIVSIPLHPIKTTFKNRPEELLFGSQDLGIVAYK